MGQSKIKNVPDSSWTEYGKPKSVSGISVYGMK